MIAFIEAQRAGLFRREHWPANLVAGVVVGIVAMPLAMAFAIASGATPAQGLYTAIVAGVATSLLGGTRVQISGPTGAFVAVLAGITAQYGIAGLQAATFLAGVSCCHVARIGASSSSSRACDHRLPPALPRDLRWQWRIFGLS